MGPNDVSGVIRAHSRHRRPLSRSSCITTVYTIKNKLVFFIKKTKKNEKKTHLWPKQRIWRHLGPFSSSLPTPSRILFLRIYIYYKILVSIQKNKEIIKKILT